ncbi:hypothetical protein ACROYT_G015423 [Oculina patagonica]
MFSCFARRLMKKDIHTLSQLEYEMGQSYTPKVEVREINTVFDAKDWMEADMNDMSGHIHQHQFKIVRNSAGQAVVYYKKWSTDKDCKRRSGEMATLQIAQFQAQPNWAHSSDVLKESLTALEGHLCESAGGWYLYDGIIRGGKAEYVGETPQCKRPEYVHILVYEQSVSDPNVYGNTIVYEKEKLNSIVNFYKHELNLSDTKVKIKYLKEILRHEEVPFKNNAKLDDLQSLVMNI